MRVTLTFDETVDDYLARFKQMMVKCFTPIAEIGVVKKAASGLEFHIRKKTSQSTSNIFWY